MQRISPAPLLSVTIRRDFAESLLFPPQPSFHLSGSQTASAQFYFYNAVQRVVLFAGAQGRRHSEIETLSPTSAPFFLSWAQLGAHRVPFAVQRVVLRVLYRHDNGLIALVELGLRPCMVFSHYRAPLLIAHPKRSTGGPAALRRHGLSEHCCSLPRCSGALGQRFSRSLVVSRVRSLVDSFQDFSDFHDFTPPPYQKFSLNGQLCERPGALACGRFLPIRPCISNRIVPGRPLPQRILMSPYRNPS